MAEKLTARDHNSAASKATFLAHLRKVSGAKTALEEANGVYRSLLKAAKKDGVNNKQLVAVLHARRLDQEDVARDQAVFGRYMAWMGLPVGSQASLLDELGGDEDTTQADDDAHREWEAAQSGYRAGRDGVKEADCPYLDGTESHLAKTWRSAWHNGQASLKAEMGPGVEKVAAPKRGGGVPKAAKGMH